MGHQLLCPLLTKVSARSWSQTVSECPLEKAKHATASLHQSSSVDFLTLKALIRIAPGKEGDVYYSVLVIYNSNKKYL